MSDSTATNRIIPIFPLPVVQFPTAITPLYIFEPRYRKMLRDVMEKDKTFGIIYRSSAEEGAPRLESDLIPLGSVGALSKWPSFRNCPTADRTYCASAERAFAC